MIETVAKPETKFLISAENRASPTLQKVAKDFDSLGAAAKSAGSVMTGFAGLAGVAAAAFSLRGVSQEIKRIADLQDSFGKLAQQTGVTVEALTELDYAASLSDVSTGELGDALGRLSTKMADAAHGSAAAKGAFSDLGVKVQNTDGTLRSSEEVLKDIAQRFSEFKDGSTKTAYAIEIFGRSGAKLIPLLNSGRSGLESMGAEARRLGLVFSDEAAKAAEEFNDNLTRLSKGWDGMKISFFGPLIGALGEVTQNFLDARQAGLGFFNALGTDRTNIYGQIEGAEQKLADLQKQLDKGSRDFYGRPVDTTLLDHQIAQTKDRLVNLNRLALTMSGFGDPPAAAPSGRPPKDRGDGSGGKSKDDPLRSLIDPALDRDAARLRGIQDEIAEFWDVRVPQKLADDEGLLRSQADAWRDVIDPMRKYREQLDEITRLEREPSGLTSEEASRARQKVGEDIDKMLAESMKSLDKLDEFTLQAARNIQTHLGDETYNLLSGKFDDIGDRWLDLLRRMAADALSANLSRSLFGDFAKSGNIGGLIGQGLDWLTGAGAVSGGGGAGLGTAIVPGMTSADDWMLAGLFKKSAGIDFVPYDNYPALLHRGERVVPQIEASQGGRSVSVVNNYTFGAGVNVAQLQAAAERIKRDTEASVFNKMRRANYSGDYGAMGF